LAITITSSQNHILKVTFYFNLAHHLKTGNQHNVNQDSHLESNKNFIGKSSHKGSAEIDENLFNDFKNHRAHNYIDNSASFGGGANFNVNVQASSNVHVNHHSSSNAHVNHHSSSNAHANHHASANVHVNHDVGGHNHNNDDFGVEDWQ
jgi:hypothetical protein